MLLTGDDKGGESKAALMKKLSEAYFSTSKLLLCYLCIFHMLLTGDDKGEASKAAIVKKLSEAYSDSRTDLRYITGRVRVADGRIAREVNGEWHACVETLHCW
jgi:hypothetical protein